VHFRITGVLCLVASFTGVVIIGVYFRITGVLSLVGCITGVVIIGVHFRITQIAGNDTRIVGRVNYNGITRIVPCGMDGSITGIVLKEILSSDGTNELIDSFHEIFTSLLHGEVGVEHAGIIISGVDVRITRIISLDGDFARIVSVCVNYRVADILNSRVSCGVVTCMDDSYTKSKE